MVSFFRRYLFLIVWMSGLLLVTSCGTIQPDFARLYGSLPSEHGDEQSHPPVVVVPGLLGSRLVDRASRSEVWPGSMVDVVFGKYEQLATAIPGADVAVAALDADGITEAKLGRDFYGELLHTLVNYGGYRRAVIGEPVDSLHDRRVYVFDYDWRQDNVVTVRKFHEFIESIRSDYGDPALKVDVIAHSMGGLMARYYLRYGTQDVLNDNELQITWAGAPSINKMVLLGTPNLGSVSAIEGFILGQSVGLRRIPPEVVATMPSAFQLLPHRIVKWLYTNEGKHFDQDQFDSATWETFGWGIFAPEVKARTVERYGEAYYESLVSQFAINSERARRFSWSLTVCPNFDSALGGCPDFVEPPVRLVVFGGNCSLTPARWVIEPDEYGSDAIRFSPSKVRQKVSGVDYDALMFDPGDGTVTKPSLLARDALSPHQPRHGYSYFPLAYSFLLCAEHATLTSNSHFQDNLLDVLLTRALPWELHKDHTQN